MHATAFISDLHLAYGASQDILFKKFLEDVPKKYQELIILGDFFQVWMGDDAADDYAQRIAKSLNKLAESGVKVQIMVGNRDFMLGEAFAQQAGATLLTEPHVMVMHQKRILLMHGDSLCTDDRWYQRYRNIVRHPWTRWLFLALPIRLRKKIAHRIRQHSKQHTHQKPKAYLDVNSQAVDVALEQYQCHVLIHGHTHVAKHEQHFAGERWVLGEWTNKAIILEMDEAGAFCLVELKNIPEN